jgi:hypothetical protein
MRINLSGFRAALLTAIILALPIAANASHNNTDVEAILVELEVNRRLLVEENMNLPVEKKEGFWKIYDDYRAEIMMHEKQGLSLLQEFRDHFDGLTDERAATILTSYFELEQKTLTIRSSYVDKFTQVITPKQTLRFYQIENKIEAIIQADISSVTPLVAD